MEEIIRAAEKQIHSYSLDEKLVKAMGNTTLVKLILIFCGHDLIHAGATDGVS